MSTVIPPMIAEPEMPELPGEEELPYDDGEPLETPWHRYAMNLLIECVEWRWRDRDDFFVGGNMFVYYSPDRSQHGKFRGPDFFLVHGVPKFKRRKSWRAWAEDSRLPDVIIELLSESTAHVDRGPKKDLYEKTFGTREYFLFDPETNQWEGWRLGAQRKYERIEPNERGWIWSEELQVWLGLWHGLHMNIDADWPRFFEDTGELVPLHWEWEFERAQNEHLRAEAAQQRADAQRQLAAAETHRAEAEAKRASTAEAEVEKLRRELEALRAQQQKP